MNATDTQILTFWSMLADRRWDDATQILDGRKPRFDYLIYIKNAYIDVKNHCADKGELSAVIDDLYCFKGYEVERRYRQATLV